MAKILMVDDEQEICDLMKGYLEAKGYEVVISNNCRDTIPALKKENPAIMLLDWRLPDGDGIDLLQSIREFNPTVKVIMISAYDMSNEDMKRIQSLSVLKYMRKPILVDDLKEILKKISS